MRRALRPAQLERIDFGSGPMTREEIVYRVKNPHGLSRRAAA